MTIKQCISSALGVAILLTASSQGAMAWTGFSPPPRWSNDAVIALAGFFTFKLGQLPLVVYKNIEAGSAFFGQCFVRRLPGNADTLLTDDVTVYGAGGDDKIIVGTGEVTCQFGTLKTDMSSLDNKLEYLSINADGRGGNDHIISSAEPFSREAPRSYITGGDGDDVLVSIKESAVIYGGNGADRIRATNPLFMGLNRILLGQGGDRDCVESNNGPGRTPEENVVMSGGPGDNDVRSTCGNDPTNDPTCMVPPSSQRDFGFEGGDFNNGTTDKHCIAVWTYESCSTASDCFSGICKDDFKCAEFTLE